MVTSPARHRITRALLLTALMADACGCYHATGEDVRPAGRTLDAAEEHKESETYRVKATDAGLRLVSVDQCAITERYQVRETHERLEARDDLPLTLSTVVTVLSGTAGVVGLFGVATVDDPSRARDSYAQVIYVSVPIFAASLIFSGVYGAFDKQRRRPAPDVSRIEEVAGKPRPCTAQRGAAVANTDVRVTYEGLDEVIHFDRNGTYAGPLASELPIAVSWCAGTPSGAVDARKGVTFDSFVSHGLGDRRQLRAPALRAATSACCARATALAAQAECESKCASVVQASPCIAGAHACIAATADMKERSDRVADCERLMNTCLDAHHTSFDKVESCALECAARSAERTCSSSPGDR
jgi:hypothetical protein